MCHFFIYKMIGAAFVSLGVDVQPQCPISKRLSSKWSSQEAIRTLSTGGQELTSNKIYIFLNTLNKFAPSKESQVRRSQIWLSMKYFALKEMKKVKFSLAWLTFRACEPPQGWSCGRRRWSRRLTWFWFSLLIGQLHLNSSSRNRMPSSRKKDSSRWRWK